MACGPTTAVRAPPVKGSTLSPRGLCAATTLCLRADLGECSGLVKEGLFSAAFDNGMRVQVRVQRGPAAGAVLLVSVPERYPHACPRVSVAATGEARSHAAGGAPSAPRGASVF